MNVADRFNGILRFLRQAKTDALLLNNEANVSYAAGFHAPDSYALIDKTGIALITDFRYTADFERQAKFPVKIIELEKNIFRTIARCITTSKQKTVGFESRHLTFAECEILHELLGKKTQLVPLKKTIEPLRQIKTSEELTRIRRAVAITLEAYEFLAPRIKPGVTELAIAAEAERFIRLRGARAAAFEIIVASGPNASYPHATVTQRRLKKGETVVVDMGVNVDDYKSDLTRTFFLDKIPPIVQRAADTVRSAQKKAIQKIKPGVPIKDIDAAARQYITVQGFGKNFGHALGHGVGLEVHEAPGVNNKNDLPVKEGMVFTVEPGIYIAGQFGIRMEEMVLVTRSGVEVLSGNHQH